MTHKYEIELNLNEQRMALMTMVDQLVKQYGAVDRRRWLKSEKLMTKAQLSRHIIALRMAVDRIDAELKAWVHDTGRNQDHLSSDRL